MRTTGISSTKNSAKTSRSAWVKQAELDAGLRSDGLTTAEREQMEVLEAAEEYDLLEQYRIALAERDRGRRRPFPAPSRARSRC